MLREREREKEGGRGRKDRISYIPIDEESNIVDFTFNKFQHSFG